MDAARNWWRADTCGYCLDFRFQSELKNPGGYPLSLRRTVKDLVSDWRKQYDPSLEGVTNIVDMLEGILVLYRIALDILNILSLTCAAAVAAKPSIFAR